MSKGQKWGDQDRERRKKRRASEREKAKADGIGSAAQIKGPVRRSGRTKEQARERDRSNDPPETKLHKTAPVTLPSVGGVRYRYVGKTLETD